VGAFLARPEISTDGWHSYKLPIRDAFRNSAHGVIIKTVAVTDLRKDAAYRYSPARLKQGNTGILFANRYPTLVV
jgi:hypothetical protein